LSKRMLCIVLSDFRLVQQCKSLFFCLLQIVVSFYAKKMQAQSQIAIANSLQVLPTACSHVFSEYPSDLLTYVRCPLWNLLCLILEQDEKL